jgi:hypothetical protein
MRSRELGTGRSTTARCLRRAWMSGRAGRPRSGACVVDEARGTGGQRDVPHGGAELRVGTRSKGGEPANFFFIALFSGYLRSSMIS